MSQKWIQKNHLKTKNFITYWSINYTLRKVFFCEQISLLKTKLDMVKLYSKRESQDYLKSKESYNRIDWISHWLGLHHLYWEMKQKRCRY